MAEGVAERRAAGELEASVLAALWAADGPQTVGQVQHSLAVELARTTVTTALTRLFGKGPSAGNVPVADLPTSPSRTPTA